LIREDLEGWVVLCDHVETGNDYQRSTSFSWCTITWYRCEIKSTGTWVALSGEISSGKNVRILPSRWC